MIGSVTGLLPARSKPGEGTAGRSGSRCGRLSSTASTVSSRPACGRHPPATGR